MPAKASTPSKPKCATVRLAPGTDRRLTRLAKATGRNRASVIQSAIESYLDVNDWQIREIKKAVKQAASVSARWIDHHVLKARFGIK